MTEINIPEVYMDLLIEIYKTKRLLTGYSSLLYLVHAGLVTAPGVLTELGEKTAIKEVVRRRLKGYIPYTITVDDMPAHQHWITTDDTHWELRNETITSND